MITYQNLTVSYDYQPVLLDINLTLKRGEIVVIVGISGSGKSTLLRSTLGLLSQAATIENGQIFYKDCDLLKIDTQKFQRIRGNQIAMMFQQPGLFFSPIVKMKNQIYETIQSHMTERVDKRAINLKILEAFERINLKDGPRILESYPFQLSGGMVQMTTLGILSLLEPHFLLADEPTSALDVIHQKEVLKEMVRLKEELNMGLLLVTHNLEIAELIADRVVILEAGQVIEQGDVKQILNAPQHPVTQSLVHTMEELRK